MTAFASEKRSVPRVLVVLCTAALAACAETPTEIRGAAISSYMPQVSVNGVSSNVVPADAPPAGSGPSISGPASVETITGGSLQIDVSASSSFQTMVLKIDGVDGHLLVTLPQMISGGEMVITVASAVPELAFSYQYAVAGANGVYGPYATTSVSATEVIRGDIQVSVTWRTLADVDLHVIDPSGEEIYYGNRRSASGGELDLDANAACSTSNIYQENIGWPRGQALPGRYIIRVDYWDACGETQTDFVVTLSTRPGVPSTPITPGALLRTFSGSFTGPGTQGGAGDGVTITTFTF